MRVWLIYIPLFIFELPLTAFCFQDSIRFEPTSETVLDFSEQDKWRTKRNILLKADKIISLHNYEADRRVNDSLTISSNFFPLLLVFDWEGNLLEQKIYDRNPNLEVLGVSIFGNMGTKNNLLFLYPNFCSLLDANLNIIGTPFFLNDAVMPDDKKDEYYYSFNNLAYPFASLLDDSIVITPKKLAPASVFKKYAFLDILNPDIYLPESYRLALYNLNSDNLSPVESNKVNVTHELTLRDSIYLNNVSIFYLDFQYWAVNKYKKSIYCSNQANYEIYEIDISTNNCNKKFGKKPIYVDPNEKFELITAYPENFDGVFSKIFAPLKEKVTHYEKILFDEATQLIYRFYSIPSQDNEESSRTKYVQVYNTEYKLITDVILPFQEKASNVHSIHDNKLYLITPNGLQKTISIRTYSIILTE